MKKEYDFLVKVLVIGDSDVGKSEIVTCIQQLDPNYIPQHIVQLGTYPVDVNIQYTNDCNLNLHVWNLVGQERFRTISSSYYRGAHIVLCVFSFTDNCSFRNTKQLLSEAQKYMSDNTVLVLIGNHCSRYERDVSESDAQYLAENAGVLFVAVDDTNYETVRTAMVLALNQVSWLKDKLDQIRHQDFRRIFAIVDIHRRSVEKSEILSDIKNFFTWLFTPVDRQARSNPNTEVAVAKDPNFYSLMNCFFKLPFEIQLNIIAMCITSPTRQVGVVLTRYATPQHARLLYTKLIRRPFWYTPSVEQPTTQNKTSGSVVKSQI